jgi:hypothetical protein
MAFKQIGQKKKYYHNFSALISCGIIWLWRHSLQMMEHLIPNMFLTVQYNTLQIQIMVTE